MRFLALTVMAVALGSPVAHAQMDSREAIQLQNEILDMRREMQSLQQNQGNGAPIQRQSRATGGSDSSNGLTAQLLDRVSTLEDQVRQLRGQVDQVTNQQQRQAEDFNKQIGDMNFAMQNSGGRAAPVPVAPPRTSSLGASDNSPASSATTSGTVLRTPELAMQEGNAALARRDYPAAAAAAREVLGRKGPRQTDGQFLLAQAEMGQRNYQQAAPDFYDAYNRARTGPHAPDALLGVANALIGVGDKTSACEALTKLRSEFPQPRQDIRDGEQAGRQRAGCR